MKFKKYNTIENSYQQEFISDIMTQGLGNLDYVVQEKVHGANLCFITDGETILTARRNELILADEVFYNAHLVLEHYQSRIFELFFDVSEQFHAKSVTIFGEILGGGYPHPEVTVDSNAQLVQRGIYYCPYNDFYAFDILINGESYLDTETINQFFEKHKFHYAKTLFKGNFSECLSFPNAFKTTIPKEFNLPELEGNICEGVVIRPIKPLFLKNGERVMVKNKNEKWAENNNYIDKSLLNRLLKLDGENLSENAKFLCEEIYKLITINRLNNIVSKIGIIDPKKDLGKVLGLFNKDVIADFLKNNQLYYNTLEKQEMKFINKFLNKHAGEMIYDIYQNQ
jgi:Rnl2 family RNA ligase